MRGDLRGQGRRDPPHDWRQVWWPLHRRAEPAHPWSWWCLPGARHPHQSGLSFPELISCWPSSPSTCSVYTLWRCIQPYDLIWSLCVCINRISWIKIHEWIYAIWRKVSLLLLCVLDLPPLSVIRFVPQSNWFRRLSQPTITRLFSWLSKECHGRYGSERNKRKNGEILCVRIRFILLSTTSSWYTILESNSLLLSWQKNSWGHLCFELLSPMNNYMMITAEAKATYHHFTKILKFIRDFEFDFSQ